MRNHCASRTGDVRCTIGRIIVKYVNDRFSNRALKLVNDLNSGLLLIIAGKYYSDSKVSQTQVLGLHYWAPYF